MKKYSAFWSLLPIRLIIGYGFFMHGYGKLVRGPEFFVAILQGLGTPAPEFTAWVTILLEVLGGVAILGGVTSVLLFAPLAVIMLVALFTVHLPLGFSSVKLLQVGPGGPQFGAPGMEVCLLYLAGLLALYLGGAQPYSFGDLRRKCRGQAALALLLLAFFSVKAQAASQPRFKAVAFDYFVIFDPNSVVATAEKVFPGKGLEFTKAWRAKQFEYGYLRSITSSHKDFFLVTGDALDYTAESMQLKPTAEQRQQLLDAYLHLKPWPDTVAMLEKIRASGMKIITIANFSKEMLEANARNAGIEKYFAELLSTEVNKTYKPDPKAYELGMKRLGLKKDEIAFAAFGGWDAYGAKTFGYQAFWVNRFGMPAERVENQFDGTARDAEGLLYFLGLDTIARAQLPYKNNASNL